MVIQRRGDGALFETSSTENRPERLVQNMLIHEAQELAAELRRLEAEALRPDPKPTKQRLNSLRKHAAGAAAMKFYGEVLTISPRDCPAWVTPEQLERELNDLGELSVAAEFDPYADEALRECAVRIRAIRKRLRDQEGEELISLASAQAIVDSLTEKTTREELLQALGQLSTRRFAGPDPDALFVKWRTNAEKALTSKEWNGSRHPDWYAEAIREEEAELAASAAAPPPTQEAIAALKRKVEEIDSLKEPLLDLLFVGADETQAPIARSRVKNTRVYLRSRWRSEPEYRREFVGKCIMVADVLRNLDLFLEAPPSLTNEAEAIQAIVGKTPGAPDRLKAEFFAWRDSPAS